MQTKNFVNYYNTIHILLLHTFLCNVILKYKINFYKYKI